MPSGMSNATIEAILDGTQFDTPAPWRGREEQYLWLTNRTNWLIEFTDGLIEVLPMPTCRHQAISGLLYIILQGIMRRGGVVLFAPMRLLLRPGKYRQPDQILLLDKTDSRNQESSWLGADLVIEIVLPDSVERDTVRKRADYAEAGISEYWIVNPIDETVSVLVLGQDGYDEQVFSPGQVAASALLPEFAVPVNNIFAAE